MHWYKNLKINNKFILTFAVTLLCFLNAAIVSFLTIFYVINTFDENVSTRTSVIDTCTNVVEKIVNTRVTVINTASKDISAAEKRKELEQPLQEARDTISEFLDSIYGAIPTVSDISVESIKQQGAICENAMEQFELYVSNLFEYFDAVEAGNTALANSLDAEINKIGESMFKDLFSLPDIAYQGLIGENQIVKDSSYGKVVLIFAIYIISIVIYLALAISLSKSITKPVAKIKEAALQVAEGELDVYVRTNNRDEIGELSNAVSDMADTIQSIIEDIDDLSNNLEKGNIYYRINSNKYKGAFKVATEAVNTTVNQLIEDSLYVIDTVKEFGDGKFEATVKDFPGDKVIIKEGLTSVQTALKNVSNDIVSLIEAANKGDLEFRLDTNKYVGEWKETTDGLNSFVENVVVPIKETQNALNQFSKGNFAHRITNEYKGEFNNIKQTVNFTAETIGSYINEISETLTEMANKNFDISIDREYLGDFESIKQSVNLIVDNLNALTKDIISSAEQVSSGARQIAESSTSLAQGATEQAGAVEELTSTVSIISDQSKANAINSEKANDLALDAKDSADRGSQQMDKMLLAMEEINTASNSISNIIKVIDDIAFQTNILALNAAVEAARAGEHGKGFAVVAEEVRNLAARSQQAAKETTDLIETSVIKVEEGSKIANDTAESLVNIVKQIEEISSLISSCAVSSKEQEKSIGQITIGIDQISVVTQSNTATSEESAAASEELSSQADIFYESVSDFKLRD